MERKVVVMCLLVIFLSLISVGLAFAAELTKIQISSIVTMDDGRCGYPWTPASPLGMLSTLVFMCTHVLIYAAAGCICCKRRDNLSNLKWVIGLVCFTISWLVFLPTISLLLHAAFLNDQGDTVGTNSYLESTCGAANDGLFTSGGILVQLPRHSLLRHFAPNKGHPPYWGASNARSFLRRRNCRGPTSNSTASDDTTSAVNTKFIVMN